MTTIGLVPLDKIVADDRCQQRAAINFGDVQEWSEAMREGAPFPALIVYHDGKTHWLADGFTRLKAAKMAGVANFECEIRAGTLDDAIVFSCTANTKNRAQRWNGADKRKAVRRMLDSHPEWSDRRIAKHCDVTHPFVGAQRERLSGNVSRCEPQTRLVERGGTEYEMTVSPPSAPAAEGAKPRRVGPTWEGPEPTREEELRNRFSALHASVYTIALGETPAHDIVSAARDKDELLDFAADCDKAAKRIREFSDAARADPRSR